MTPPHASARAPDQRPSDGPHCPFCGSRDTELLSLFGSQLLTEQRYCRACHTPFERIKDDADDDTDDAEADAIGEDALGGTR